MARRLLMFCGVLTVAAASVSPLGKGGVLWRGSLACNGVQGTAESKWTSVSASGRFIAFLSDASNLVTGDTNGFGDVFLFDHLTRKVERVSLTWDGRQANNHCIPLQGASLSEDASLVAFYSWATNLVPNDNNGWPDIFVRDVLGGKTERVSVANDGTEGNHAAGDFAISGDGRFVVFSSHASNLVENDTNGFLDVFVRDRWKNTTERVSVSSTGEQSNGHSANVSISADGRFVAFESSADNLVSNDTMNVWDIFVHDRETGVTEMVSVSSTGEQANGTCGWEGTSISADGRSVVFASEATNLVPGDTNRALDVFVHDRWTHTTERVSVSSRGQQGTRRSDHPVISGDGRYVAFYSTSNNLVPNDTNNTGDIFVHDRLTRETWRVSVSTDGNEGNAGSTMPAISYNGHIVAFHSGASNLVPRDTNRKNDVFVHFWRRE